MSARRFALIAFAGFVLVQAVWILAVPPFRGIDEFDHAYRAAGVAHGQWRLTEFAENGRGVVVEVPVELIEAASAQCDALPYPGPDNCFPIRESGDGDATVATAAGLYNPMWYAVVGLPSRFLDGANALYGMRVLSALLCGVGVSLAAWAIGLTRPGPWTKFAFLMSLTPVFAYSTVLPAPNGPEMVAGLTLWASLIALFTVEKAPSRINGGLFLLANSSALLLVTLRTLGPLWLAMIVLSVMVLVGLPRVILGVRSHLSWWIVSTVVVSLGLAAGAWWSLSAGLTDASPDVMQDGGVASWSFGLNPIVWLLQMIAAFPLRGNAASPGVYLSYSLVLVLIVGVGVRRGDRRLRALLAAMLVVVVLMPIGITLLTVETQGLIWQGRYQLPWAVGVLLVAGISLDRSHFLPRERGRVLVLAAALLALAQAWSIHGLAVDEGRRRVSIGDPGWVTLPPAVLATACFMVSCAWLSYVGRSPRSQPDDQQVHTVGQAAPLSRDGSP